MFIESIIIKPETEPTTEDAEDEREKNDFVHKGKLSEKFEEALKRLEASCKLIFTLLKQVFNIIKIAS